MAIGAMILAGFVIIALLRGRAEWGQVPVAVWVHLVTIMTVLVLTPVMLRRPRGDRMHRRIGRVWAVMMALTAIDSFFVRLGNHGGFSIIHLLSVWVLVQVPVIVWTARTHNIVRHRNAVRGMVLGALLIAGFFTFPFDRLLGHWLFS